MSAVVLLYGTAYSTGGGAGSAGAYLRPAVGATAMAMGGAYSASPGYLISWYTPSFLASLRESRVSVGGAYRSMGRTEAFSSFEFRVPPRLGAGITVLYRGDPFITGLYDGYYNEQGIVIEEQPLERAAFSTLTTRLGAGYLFSRSLYLGGSIAVFYQNQPMASAGDGTVLNESVTSIGGFDLAATYIAGDNLNVSFSVKNLGARVNWQIQSNSWQDVVVDVHMLPSFVLAGSLNTSLNERPLVVNVDLVSHLIDGQWKRLKAPELTVKGGAQWQYWENFYLMAGIGDLEFSTEMADRFSPRVTAGFSWHLERFSQGTWLHYALATDRVWAGIDQQIDVTFSF